MADRTFPERLKIVRDLWEAKRGGAGTDQDFAGVLGLTPQNYSGVKNSLKPPPAERVLDMAARASRDVGIRIDPGWLLYGPASRAPAPVVPAVAVTKRKRGAPIADPGSESQRAARGKRAS